VVHPWDAVECLRRCLTGFERMKMKIKSTNTMTRMKMSMMKMKMIEGLEEVLVSRYPLRMRPWLWR